MNQVGPCSTQRFGDKMKFYYKFQCLRPLFINDVNSLQKIIICGGSYDRM